MSIKQLPITMNNTVYTMNKVYQYERKGDLPMNMINNSLNRYSILVWFVSHQKSK